MMEIKLLKVMEKSMIITSDINTHHIDVLNDVPATVENARRAIRSAFGLHVTGHVHFTCLDDLENEIEVIITVSENQK